MAIAAVIAFTGCGQTIHMSTEAIPTTDNSLTVAEQGLGWRLLFDGTTHGWRGFNKAELPEGWTAENGTLTSRGITDGGDTGGDIVYSLDEFENFELVLDWKISPGGNSGVFYHAQEGCQYKAPYETAPEYQLIDDVGFPGTLEDWQKVGVDYAMYTTDAPKVMKPAGEWNTSRIVFTPEKAEYFLNGQKTVEFVPYSADWEQRRNSGKWDDFPDYGKFKTGLIALQDHGSPVWFKNIKIRKL